MVKVCDAIMGSGKTSAAISYINAHPEKRFLYITPYLPEAARIKNGCPRANFVEPSENLPMHKFSKAVHTLALISDGRNIASTHQAMMYYTRDTINMLKEKNYTLIIDEEVTVMQQDKDISYEDVKIAETYGLVRETLPGEYVRTDMEYSGGNFSHMLRLMASRPLLYISIRNENGVFYWVFPPDMMAELDDVVLLTYLFKNSEMEMFFKMHNIPYKNIWISKSEDGSHTFSDEIGYVPEYVTHLGDMIHIEDNEKMNSIGKNRTALSMNWYNNNLHTGVEQLRKNIYTYFRKNESVARSNGRMCGTYKRYWGRIRSKGYWNGDVMFSQKASNKFKDRTVLAYPVNLFNNGSIVSYYAKNGFNFDNDQYALSIMVQWIWRSAIRDGKEIWLYIPSKRMRDLLVNWIEEVGK